MKKNQTKKILISILGFFPGGAEIFPIRLANALQEMGYHVGIHCTKHSVDHAVRKLLNPGIPIYTTDRFWRMALVLFLHGYRIVNSHCIASQQLMARVRKRIPFLRVRHIATSHGGYEGMGEEDALTLLRYVDKAVDAWTYVADNNLPLFHQAGIVENKLHKIGNAMEAPAAILPCSMADYGIPEDAFVFSVITRAVEKKGWPACIEAVREARRISGKDIHLLLGGRGEVYDRLIKESTEDFVHLVGEIAHPCDVYAASHCGLLLSVLECAPLGIIEMYFAGIPVVATDTGDVKEMLQSGDEKTGILVSLTANGQVPIPQAAQAIAEMTQNNILYMQRKNAASRKALEYRMDTVSKRYLSVYGENDTPKSRGWGTDKAVSKRYLAAKRAFDFICSLMASILLQPLFLVLAILIYIDDPGASPIFAQTRVGKGGKPFRMYKFRSMVANAEALRNQLADRNEMDGPAFKIKDDPRTTRFGHFLRASNLDELPQIWNVLRGDMSLVGPRPPLPDEVEHYTPEQKIRLSIMPGITCYWQTANNRNDLHFDQWMALDKKYIRERGFLVDLRILLQTAVMPLHKNNSKKTGANTFFHMRLHKMKK